MHLPLKTILISLIALVALGGAVSALSMGNDSSPITKLKGTNSSCLDKGVSLVVDFGSTSNKAVIQSCARNFASTGWAVFEAAGVSVQGTSEFPESFACRIQGWPEDSKQDCADTPRYDEGSWAYYFADVEHGNKWLLSGVGATMRKPECGSFEGWVFLGPGEDRDKSKPSVTPEPFICK